MEAKEPLMRVRVVVAVAASLLAVATATVAQEAGTTHSQGTAAVQVTDNPAKVRAHSSPQMAVNPNTGTLAIVEADVRGDKQCAVHLSTDDGRSWFAGGTVVSEPYTDCTLDGEWGPYASIGFATDGTLYVAFVASEAVEPSPEWVPRHVFLARSTDGGRTFTTSRVYEAPDEYGPARNKGPMVAIDPNDSDRVFVGWRQGEWGDGKLKSMVAASTDGGQTFAEPVDISGDSGADYPGLAVDGGGTLHAVSWARVWPQVDAPEDTPVRPIFHRRSTDGGETFSDPVEIAPGNQDHEKPPVIAADADTNNLYVVWAANEEPRNRVPGFEGDLDVFFATSTNGGDTWSDPTVLNGDDTATDQSAPGIDVAPDGRIDIAWYDNRHTPKGAEAPLQDVYATWSQDGGQTFSPNARITDRSIDRSIGIWGNNIGSHHNVGVASREGGAYMAWQDSRNADPVAQPEDVYMAKLPMSQNSGVVSTDATGSPWLWGLLGAGVALALSGIAVVGGLSRLRRAPSAARRDPA
jgi:hypothetical protein